MQLEKKQLVLLSVAFIAVLAVMYKLYNSEEKASNNTKPDELCDLLQYLCGNQDALRQFAKNIPQYVGDKAQMFPVSENAEPMAKAALKFCVNNAANFFCPSPNPLNIGTSNDRNAAAMHRLVSDAGCSQ